jgi:hypothetical protein
MPSPESVFDVLTVAAELADAPHGVSRVETHLFDYLACLLSVYRGRPASDWGPLFIRSEWGSPFSPDIEDAVETLLATGYVEAGGELLVLGRPGRQLLQQMRSLRICSDRQPFLEAACSSVLAMPVGRIRAALSQEPTAQSASYRRTAGTLLAGPATELLYKQFSALSEAIGVQVSDLFVPSVVWLTYLDKAERYESKRKVLSDA